MVAGLFLVTLSALMYEILLTRIFSVTMWYHFAFVAISVAMFGMTVGAVLVYLLSQIFTRERAPLHLPLTALLFAASVVASFLVHIRIPQPELNSFGGLFSLVATFGVVSVPFVFSGMCVCLALTKFPRHVSKLYAADLAGAAAACILLICLLKVLDGPTAVIAVSFLASLGAWLFALDIRPSTTSRIAALFSVLFLALTVTNAVLASQQRSLFRLEWVKGIRETKPLFEKWNTFSRVRIYNDPPTLSKPFGWGFSPTYSLKENVRQFGLNIDASAFTVLTNYAGDTRPLEYLKYDVTNIVHYLKRDADVFVIGAGGGRDVLTALVFEQRAVTAVEINGDILRAVNGIFGKFTGHLDRNPKVRFVNDEARSYIARSKTSYDIIQSSLVDTWAATAAGAFVLSENSLYTVDAWTTFLQRLNPKGILTFSRWFSQEREVLMYRLTALANAALQRTGVRDPGRHIQIVRGQNIGTILVSRDPFTPEDIDTIEDISRKMGFDVILSPRSASDATFRTLADTRDLASLTRQFTENIVPPTDNSPFFFQIMRIGNIFKHFREFRSGPVPMLGYLLVIVLCLTLLFILVPLILTTRKSVLKGAFPLFLFFGGIGLGFMLVEVSQMQRLIIFLGHPTYSLSVVLFTLLLAGSLGSYSTRRVKDEGLRTAGVLRLILLLVILAVFAAGTPGILSAFQGVPTAVRFLLAGGCLAPIGIFMGMAFPLGIKLASRKSEGLTPWLWGINGSASVVSSVAAVIIALGFGITAAFWVGVGCYAFAVLAFVWSSRRF
jgi:predicted membrane-bound spermidine synthase